MNDRPAAGLPRLATVKLVLVIAGITTFGLGIRYDNVWIRWAGVAVVAVAWVLRFAKSRTSAQPGPE